jgi:glycosyltransferase involved in cell wall biosynthesis
MDHRIYIHGEGMSQPSMRVLLLTEERISFTDALTRGGAIHVRNVARGLGERGHDTILIDWNPTAERTWQLSVSPRTRFVDGPLRTLRRAIAVGRTTDINVIVSKTRKTYLPGLLAARRLGVPHVVHVGSSLERPEAGPLDRLNVASVSARLRAPHDAYFVVCEHIAEQLENSGISADRIYDVKNAVDTDRFHPSTVPVELDDEFRAQLPAGPQTLRLGYVGGLQPYKGLADLAAAMDRMSADCELIVAGDGPDRERLERKFGDSATFLGAVPYEQIPALYHEVETFVLPSHTEGLPRVVLEAQATATPVVATRVGGVPEVIEDESTGLLCEPRDPSGLAADLQRLADDSDLRSRLGDAGRGAVAQSYSWDALYDRYEEYLAAVVGQ